jgi:hypothetical protein
MDPAKIAEPTIIVVITNPITPAGEDRTLRNIEPRFRELANVACIPI